MSAAKTIPPLSSEQIDAIIAALDERAILLQGRIRRATSAGTPLTTRVDEEVLARFQGQLADVESALVLVLTAA